MFGQVTVYIVDEEDDVQLRASSSSVAFSGFLDVYKVRSSLVHPVVELVKSCFRLVSVTTSNIWVVWYRTRQHSVDL